MATSAVTFLTPAGAVIQAVTAGLRASANGLGLVNGVSLLRLRCTPVQIEVGSLAALYNEWLPCYILMRQKILHGSTWDALTSNQSQ